MGDLTLFTLDWVPESPRGFVRDLRVRWACEEAGLRYRVEGVPFADRSAEHFRHQPFGQVPWIVDGDLSIFESGAILLHLGASHEPLLPADPKRRSEAIEWVFAALNSVEMAALPWAILHFSKATTDAAFARIADFLGLRLEHMETVLGTREWLAGGFSIADILMADVLRLVDRFGGLAGHPSCAAYLARASARPAYAKAYADQLAWYAAADRARAPA